MRQCNIILAFLFILVLGFPVSPAHAQMDPVNPPEPPVEELSSFGPFLGLYAHSEQYWGDLGPFTGTLEVVPAVKGWYVEWIINTHHRAIDRQLRMIMTWDRSLERYRVWRFSTVPPEPPGAVEGEARFVGDTLFMVWEDVPNPRGDCCGTFRNRAFMDGSDELVIISDVLPEGGTERIRLGEWRSKRRL